MFPSVETRAAKGVTLFSAETIYGRPWLLNPTNIVGYHLRFTVLYAVYIPGTYSLPFGGCSSGIALSGFFFLEFSFLVEV